MAALTGSPRRTCALVALVLLLVAAAEPAGVGAAGPAVSDQPVPRAACGPGSNPESSAPGQQGRVSADDVKSGRAAKGYTCNTQLLGHYGTTGGYKVQRYVDGAGHECAYFDSTLLFPGNALTAGGDLTGVYVLDMTHPARPVRTDNLVTPAMQSPHESLSLNQKRGLLVADMGYPTFNPGFVDVYDLAADCRHPALKASVPTGILGHEGNFSPDGNTFWVSSTGGKTLTAVDLTDPTRPLPLWTTTDFIVHGLNVSDDGNRLYFADLGNPSGVTILDVSEVQQRKPNPQVRIVSRLTWDTVSIPQVPIPVRINGHPFLVEVDEFSRGVAGSDPKSPVGAARVIDIADDTKPQVVSNIRLEVNTPQARASDQANDPGATNGLQGYAAHYCAVPNRNEPGVVACSFILSGLRLFDIRDPYHPREIAYFNAPVQPSRTGGLGSNYAMSGATFVPQRGEIWYSDGNSGFYAVRVTNGIWPFPPPALPRARATAVPKAKRPPSRPRGRTRRKPRRR